MKTTLRIKLTKHGIFKTPLLKDMIIRVFSRWYIPHGKVRLSRTTFEGARAPLNGQPAQNVTAARMFETRSTVF